MTTLNWYLWICGPLVIGFIVGFVYGYYFHGADTP